MQKNEVYVTTDLDDGELWHKELMLTDIHWIHETPDKTALKIRTRYRAPLVDCTIDHKTGIVVLKNEVRALTAGQSAVFYDSQQCLGGGIIA